MKINEMKTTINFILFKGLFRGKIINKYRKILRRKKKVKEKKSVQTEMYTGKFIFVLNYNR